MFVKYLLLVKPKKNMLQLFIIIKINEETFAVKYMRK